VARRHTPAEPKPILIVGEKGDRRLVMHASADAQQAGVIRGMDLAHARALIRHPGLLIEPYRPARDAIALDQLAVWAMRWSPVVAADQPDGLMLDISGCGHLFGGDKGLAISLRKRLGKLGFTARIAVASTPGAAWGAARFGPAAGILIQPGREREAMSPLPVESLRLSENVVDALGEVGIRTVAQLLDIPRSSLPARYGQETIRRLDEALGRSHAAVLGVRQTEAVQTHLELPGGTTQLEAIELGVRHLLEELIRILERQESGLRRLDATFQRLDSAQICIVVQVSRPTRSGKHLWSLLRPRIERMNLGYGVTGIVLCAAGVVRIAHAQTALIAESEHTCEHDAAIDQTIDTIAGRLGANRVCRFLLRESHRPESAAWAAPLLDCPRVAPAHTTESDRPDRLACERPSVLLAEPQPVNILSLSPDGPVMSITRQGSSHRIISSIGPERIGGEWWRAREPQRDYFRVQDETGRWMWIFREARSGDGQSDTAAAKTDSSAWFIHGEWA
jgi:protein ImuB